jgi:hypothetical protein
MSAPWDRPCEVEGCERTAVARVFRSAADPVSVVCNSHIPADAKSIFNLDD